MKMKTLIILMLATGAFGAVFYPEGNPDSPRKTCSKKTLRFPFKKELYYNYVGETVSSVNGSSTAQSGLKIKARCVIKTVGACQHVLKIDSVELWEGQSKNLPIEYRLSREHALFARELEAHELVFRSRKGAIVEVLSSYDETSQALNIKKGILSALQAQFIRNDSLVNETDITGKCPVQYRIHSKHLTGALKVISKTRNLEECANRSKTYFGIHVHQNNEKFNIHSRSNCRFLLDSKRRIKKVVCQERHFFRPFSSGAPAGATTTTKQILEIQKYWRIPIQYGYNVKGLRSSPLTFEHVRPKSESLDSNKVIEIIKQLANQSIEEIKPESARLFSRIIFHLRELKRRAVERVWDAIFDCDKLESCTPQEKDKFQMYLLDALPHCGTSGCALVMSRAIERKLVNDERGNMFLTGLARLSVPTEDMIRYVLNLCQSQPRSTCMLTLGTLIHNYCENENCDSLDDVSPIIKAETWFIGHLGMSCNFTKAEEAEKIMMALKAIAKAGRPSSGSAQFKLLDCFRNRRLPSNMTIATLEALRRMPCNATIRLLISSYFKSGRNKPRFEVLISGFWVIKDKCSNFDDGDEKAIQDMFEKVISQANTSALLAAYRLSIAVRNKIAEEFKKAHEEKYVPSTITKELQRRLKQSLNEVKDHELPLPLREYLSLDRDFHKQTNWPLPDESSSAVSLIDFVVKMAVDGNTDKHSTKSLLFLEVEASIPTILGLPLKLEAKGTAVVSAVENKDPVVFFAPVTFNYLGNRKISAAIEIASRMGVDVDLAVTKGIISRNTLYIPSQSGTMEVLNTGF